MNDQEFDKLRLAAFETGEIPEEYYCGECGCVKVTLDQSYELEDIFYQLSSSPPDRPIFVEVCKCGEEDAEKMTIQSEEVKFS